jgi:hypothetical protein
MVDNTGEETDVIVPSYKSEIDDCKVLYDGV